MLYVSEKKAGDIDDEILSDAYREERILITEDKDFRELVYRFKKPTHGIVFLRVDVHERHIKWFRLKRLIDDHGTKLQGRFTVVDAQKFRFRPLLL